MNLANQLTFLRVLLVPGFMYLLLSDLSYGQNGALIVFLVASITDFFDGYIARKYDMVTKFGKFMDPLADKLLVTAALICFVQMGQISSWVVVIILSREFIVSIFRAVAAADGIGIAASMWGKYKTVSQMVMIILILLNNRPFDMWHIPMDQIFIVIATALTIISGLDYILKNKQVLRETK